MYYYSSWFKLLFTERKETDKFYAVELNENTLKILSLIFEFKIANSTHIARFFGKGDRDKHIYAKMRRMWQGNLLESFKVHEGGNIAHPLYYTLSKEALRLLERKGIYDDSHIKKYPKKDTYLSPNFFKHECMVVELASLESRIANDRMKLTFKGEASSVVHVFRYDSTRDYMVEIFTPDYVVEYRIEGNLMATVFTEYERTPKSKDGLVKKVDRYLFYLKYEDRHKYTLRIIFETEAMERAFWKAIINQYNMYESALHNLLIVTTNLSLINTWQNFQEQIYATRQQIRLWNQDREKLEIRDRMRLPYPGKDSPSSKNA